MPYSPAKPLLRSATLCVGRDCAHFRHILFFFFFIFPLFFVRAAGAGSGTLKVKTLKGMLSYERSFAAWNACRRSESEEWQSPVFPKFIAYSRHQFRVRCRYWTDNYPGAAGRYGHDLIPWILTTFRGRAGMGKIQGIFIGNRKFAVDAAMPEI